MYCKYCGKETIEKAEICTHCGRRLRNSFVGFFENSDFLKLKPQGEIKSPGFAAFLGFVLGWVLMGPVGYLYLGQWGWFWLTVALSLIAGFFFSIPLLAFFPIALVFLCLFYSPFPFIFAAHQYHMAKKLNAMHDKTQNGLNKQVQ